MAATKKTDGEFKDAAAVENVITPMQNIENLRASDRAKINTLFNGQRPYTPEEESKYNIQINVNWGEGKRILRDANSQLNSALLHPGILFKCNARRGQVDKRDEWSETFTQNIHTPLQSGESGRRFMFTVKNRNATICLHGVGALLWPNDFKWMPRFVGLEDLLIPTETYCDFTNLRYFAVNMYLTPGELISMTKGDKVQPGWNQEMVDLIMKDLKDKYSQSMPSTWRSQPEDMAQIVKENNGYYYSDAVPKIACRWFFYQEVNEPNKWYRCMILRQAYGEAKPGEKFLFDGRDLPFADSISQIISIQYGDNNFVAPLKYHVVRGLGVDLYAPIETNNRLRCQFVQSVFEHLLMYFRINDPADRDRLKQIVLSQYGILPEGLQIVPRTDRHQIDPRLVEEAMGQMDGIMRQSSSSFQQDISQQGSTPITAKEATIRLNQANVMVSSMLQSLYLQEGFFYEEIVRRFCKKHSADAEVVKFQQACIKQGVPEEMVYDHNAWRVTPERVLGGGDKSLAQQEASWLWSVKEQLDPAVQPLIKRTVVGTILGDWDKAKSFVPIAPDPTTSGVMMAEQLFGTLMTGNPCSTRKGIDQEGYIDTLIRMMAAVIQQIQNTDNTGTFEQIAGLMNVTQNISQHIQIVAQDKAKMQMVKQWGDVLGKLVNEVKGFGQRLAQKHESANVSERITLNYKDAPEDIKRQMEQASGFQPSQMPPEVDPAIAKTQAEIQLKGQAHDQQMVQSQQSFELEQQRKNIQTASEIHRQNMAHKAKLMNDHIKAVSDNLIKSQQAKNSVD